MALLARPLRHINSSYIVYMWKCVPSQSVLLLLYASSVEFLRPVVRFCPPWRTTHRYNRVVVQPRVWCEVVVLNVPHVHRSLNTCVYHTPNISASGRAAYSGRIQINASQYFRHTPPSLQWRLHPNWAHYDAGESNNGGYSMISSVEYLLKRRMHHPVEQSNNMHTSSRTWYWVQLAHVVAHVGELVDEIAVRLEVDHVHLSKNISPTSELCGAAFQATERENDAVTFLLVFNCRWVLFERTMIRRRTRKSQSIMLRKHRGWAMTPVTNKNRALSEPHAISMNRPAHHSIVSCHENNNIRWISFEFSIEPYQLLWIRWNIIAHCVMI